MKTSMLSVFLVGSFFFFSFTAIAETPSAAYDLPKLVAVQDREHYLNRGLSLSAGYLPSDAFNKGVIVGATYTHFFTDYFAWEVANFNYSFNIETSLKNELITKFPAEIENVGFEGNLDFIKFYVTSNLVYTPFYNKSLLFNKRVVRGETSFVLGAGTVKFEITGYKPIVDFGLFLRYFLTPATSLKFDFRSNFYYDADRGLSNFLSLVVSYSVQLGDPPEHLRK